MRTIVISGAQSGVGKTTLAKELITILPGSVHVKIGHHPRNPAKTDMFYPQGTSYSEIVGRHTDARTLIIESNSVLNELAPDCLIYLPGPAPKPSAAIARQKADITRGERIGPEKIMALAARLDLDTTIMRRVAWLAGARPSPVTAIILAGGKSSRMGENKALLAVHGLPLIDHMKMTLCPLFDSVLVSGGPGSEWAGNSVVEDRYPGKGPLSGIHSCLSNSTTEHNFIIACDIPSIDHATICKLLSFCDEYDIVAPAFRTGFPEPLFAFYRKSMARAAEQMIRKDQLRASAILLECKSYVHDFVDAQWYVNMNTPDDYRQYVMRNKSNETVAP